MSLPQIAVDANSPSFSCSGCPCASPEWLAVDLGKPSPLPSSFDDLSEELDLADVLFVASILGF